VIFDEAEPSGHGLRHLPGGQTGSSKFKSVRRVFRIMDAVSRRGEGLTAKQLAGEIGTNLSSCYYLLNVLVDEGYIERVPHRGGYRMGPTISLLQENARGDFDYKIEPVVEELAQRTQRRAYSAVLSEGEMAVTRVKAPPNSPPVGVVEGFRGASHALALGKVLLAGMGAKYVEGYIADHGGLEAFTLRTIVQPTLLHDQLNKVRLVGLATDFEEFAQNLCCVAAPVENRRSKVEGAIVEGAIVEGAIVEGAIGLSTTARRIHDEGRYLTEMVQWAAGEASALLKEGL
jgi:IclR family transcriptional regulator, acetate operon repressor